MSEELSQAKLERIAALMHRHQVQFIVIGGQAEFIFGSPRMTFDIDLCYRRTRENLEHLAAALKELKVSLRGAPKDLPFLLNARALALGNNYTFETPDHGDLDLLGYVAPLGDYEQLDKRASNYKVGDVELRVIDLDDLITIRQHVNRPKDRDSLRQLLAIKHVRDETGQK
jgi:predicted nucleotidyltransferase